MANDVGLAYYFGRRKGDTGGKGIVVGASGVQLTTDAADPTDGTLVAGRLSYKTSVGLRYYDGSSWNTVLAGSASGTLDNAYDSGGAGAGRSITVDSGALVGTGAHATNDTLQLANTNAAATGSLLDFANTNTATKDVDGTASNWSITGAGDGIFASLVTTGNIDAGASGVVYTRTLTADNTGDIALAIDAAGSGTIGIGATSTGAITLARAVTASAGITVTTGGITVSAGGATITGAITQTAGAVSCTITGTTGDGALIDGSTITTGNVLRLEYDAANSGAGFGALSVTEDGSEVFVIGEDGNTVIAGTAAATAALTLTTGDILVSSGRVDILGDASNADLLDITRSNTATGGDAIDIDMGSAAQAGDAIDIAWSGAGTGDGVVINMTNNVAGGALLITGAGTRTDRLLEITDASGAAGAETLFIQKTAGAASMVLLDMDGAADSDCFEIDKDGEVVGRGIYVHGAEWTGKANEGLLDLATTGTSVPAGQMLRITQASTGQHAAAINGSCIRVVESAVAPGAGTSYAVTIDATNIEALHVDTGQSTFDEVINLGAAFTVTGGNGVLNDSSLIGFGTASAEGTLGSDGGKTNWTLSNLLTLGDGGTTNYANFAASTGLLTFVGTARRTKTFFIPYSSFVLHAGSPAVAQVGAGLAWGWALDSASDEAIVSAYLVPDNLVTGAYNAFVHYAANATANNVVLDVTTLSVAEGEDLTAAGTTNSVTDTVAGTANYLNVTAAMATVSLTAGETLIVQVNRDANNVADTLAVDAVILGVEFRYTADRI